MKDEIRTFEDQKIRTAWDEKEEEWYFSVVDVIAVLTGSRDPAAYWRKLKQRLLQEGNETVTNCHRLKLPAADGKMRLTDVADLEQLFRLIQSVPSPRAEPLKRWLAEVGRERVEETIDPELTIERALETYARKGYSRAWINQRLQAIQVRKELTDEWQDRGGAVAGIARQALEAETGRPVISAQKAAELNRLAVDLIEGAARMADGKEAAKEAKEEKGEGAPDPADLPPRP